MSDPVLKVLHVIPSLSSSQGGPTSALLNMERALSARGVAVTTVVTNDDGGIAKMNVPLGVPVREGGVTRYYFNRDTSFYKASWSMRRWLNRNTAGFDLVHAHGLFTFAPLAAARAARAWGVPYVLRPMGTLSHYSMLWRRPWLKYLSFQLVEKPLLQKAALVHYTSDTELAQAQRLGLMVPPAVIPLGIDISGFTPNAKANLAVPLRLLFLSRVDRVKNLDGLLEALRIAVSRGGDFTLAIAGDGEPGYLAQLKMQAEAAGLAARVRWLGHVEGAEKEALFQDADIFVQPSHSESFGLSTVEALAHCLPCLVTQGVAIQDDIVAQGAGHSVAAADLADGLMHLSENRANLGKMATAARRLVENRYSLEAMGERLEMLYRTIAAARAKGPAPRRGESI